MSADASVVAAEKALEKMTLENKAEAPAATKEETTTEAAPAEGETKTEGSEEKGSKEDQGDNASLYVGELDPSVTEAMLFEIFNPIGPVTSVRVCRDAITRRSLGYAYVNFHNQADGIRALEELNYSPIKERPCRIMWSQRDPALRKTGAGNIYIKNLDPAIDNKALHDTFSAFGQILSCKIATDEFGNSRGFGFVHYESAESAESAIQHVNGMLLNDKKVFVGPHVPKSDRMQSFEEQKNSFTNVFIKNLGTEITEPEFEELVNKFGETSSVHLSTNDEGKPTGFGFVDYKEHDVAVKAIDGLSETEYKGNKLFAGRAKKKYERADELRKQYEASRLEKLNKYQGVNLYIKNLDDTIDDDKLRAEFAPHGTITSAKVMVDEAGKSKGFGFVCYSSPEEATKAVTEMNHRLVAGKPLYVVLAQRKDVRRSQLQQQIQAKNQMRLQQQAAAGGLPGQYMGNPGVFYPGQPGFMPPGRGGMPFGANPQMMMRPPMPPQNQFPPRGVPGGPNMYGAPPQGYQQGGFPPQGPMRGGQPPRPGQPGPQGQFRGAPRRKDGESRVADSISNALENAPEEQHKQLVGEALYPKVLAEKAIDGNAEFAGKITGMLLEMPIKEILEVIDDEEGLQAQINDAITAYNEYLNSQKEE